MPFASHHLRLLAFTIPTCSSPFTSPVQQLIANMVAKGAKKPAAKKPAAKKAAAAPAKPAVAQVKHAEGHTSALLAMLVVDISSSNLAACIPAVIMTYSTSCWGNTSVCDVRCTLGEQLPYVAQDQLFRALQRSKHWAPTRLELRSNATCDVSYWPKAADG